MDWRAVLLISILPLLTTCQGQPLGEPVVLTQSGGKFHTTLNGIASFSCRIENLGSRKLNWVFVKHHTIIFHGTDLMVDDPRYSFAIPPDGNMYTLQIYPVKEHDQGVYRCEIDGTKLGATLELVVQGSSVSPDVEGSHPPLNHTGCCQNQGVNEACLPVCDTTTTLDLNFTLHCAAEVSKLIYCGSDGRNHENCCARSEVPTDCLLLCSNDQEKMSQLSDLEMHCLNHTESIISCYEFGGDLLPTPPQSVSVLVVYRNPGYFLVVSWKQPKDNPGAVTGYKVSYKKFSDAKFRTTALLSATAYQYSLPVEVNAYYTVYVVAVANHGSSQPTERITAVIAENAQPGQAKDVLTCCKERKVSTQCQTKLCHPRVWSTFNTTDMLECHSSLKDIFSCLAGQRNNTGCCRTNNVPDGCLGMCSGSPPPFNNSLAVCIPRLSVIEACVQQGLVFEPGAPQAVTLTSVGAHTAVVTWTAPTVTGTAVSAYYVQLRRGNENAAWVTVGEVTGTYIELLNLTETETYSVRVISQSTNASSLPSASVRFTTYPELTAPGTDRPTIAHNITQCCVDSGMPLVCAQGCHYRANMTAYYAQVLQTCMMHIGTVLTCAADGRDHTSCCRQRQVLEICYGLCVHNTPGPLDPAYLACMQDTAKIVMCYQEGLENLVRMPEEVKVTNLTNHMIKLEWKQPQTGPKPESYRVAYTNLMTSDAVESNTSGLMFILQNLAPASEYTITVASYLNNSFSPPTQNVTAFTPAIDSDRPFVPQPPGDTGRVLWNNRTHCCKSSNISNACQPLCLNQPSGAVDCSKEDHNILTCAADGKDHSICCQENGLPPECLPLCSGHSATNFSVRLAGCLADTSLGIITSCFLSYSGLLPSMPYSFTARSEDDSKVRLEWMPAENCDPNTNPCTYDIHYWKADSKNLSSYTTVKSVTSPYIVTGLPREMKYTFTVTARNSYGSGAAAPWQTLYFGALRPDVSIALQPKRDVFDQGTTVTLVCDVFGFKEAPSITWRLRNHVFSSSARILRLENVNKSVEGNYSCTASSSDVTARAEIYVNVRFKPQFEYFRVDNASPGTGAEAVLACWFRGHPFTRDPVGVWSKDGQPIPQTSRHSTSAKSRFHTGITAFKLKIANVVQSDYGTYKCNVSNQFGSVSATTKLMDPVTVPTPIPPTPLEKKNVAACCRAKGVIDICMPLCTFEVSAEEAVSNPETYGVCLLYFNELIECAADGADHTLCCETEVVDGLCLPFCKGEVPQVENIFTSSHLLQCVPETPTILECIEKGYDKIPTAPRNLVASFISNRIKIAWEKPSRNADKVTSYTVYYNFSGNPQYQTETLTSTVGFNHVLRNTDVDHIYHIWMTAESYSNGRSQPTPIVSVSSYGTLPLPPTGVMAMRIDGTTVVLEWQKLPNWSPPQESFAVYYKPVNTITYRRKLTQELSITLTGLRPMTEYVAYVRSNSRAGEGLQSKPVRFTTGTQGVKGPEAEAQGGLEGGQVAGIAIAIVVVIAVIVVIAVFLVRSRTSGKQKLTDTVSFENPGYGNQQVHIGSLPGSLPGDNPYDSVMQPQAELEKDSNYGYARLHEDQATAAASNAAKPGTEGDYPNTQYATPADPSGINVAVESNGTPTSP